MFGSIAPRYDFLNHLLSLNMDKLWRAHAARVATRGLAPKRILDVACGTGDMAIELRRSAPNAHIVGLDFTHEMLAIAKDKTPGGEAVIRWVEGDGLRLPFEDGSFDLLTIAFGLRNMENLRAGLTEMRRVLRPGGRLAILEFTQPEPQFLRWFVHFAFVHALPAVANFFSRGEAYRYLADSIRAWPDRRALAARLRQCGFRSVRHELLHFRVAALHCASREERPRR